MVVIGHEGADTMEALGRRLERAEEGFVAALTAAVPATLGRAHLRLLAETVGSGSLPTPTAFVPLRLAGATGAQRGEALADVLARASSIERRLWDALRASAGPDGTDDLLTAAGRVVWHQGAVAAAVAEGYLEERLHLAAAAQAADSALVDAFLAGRPTADAAARAGRRLGAAYGVVLLQGLVPHEHLRTFEDALAALGDGEGLWRLSAGGATVLVPVPADGATAWLDGAPAVLDDLAAAAGGAALVAAVAWGADPAGVARAGDDAVTVLRLVTGLGRPPGVYRLDDVLLEAALGGTAPGPAARLADILAPLDAAAGDLLATLETYLAHDADRRLTAAALHVHPNTLDHRLRRIGELTGRAPSTARGLQVLGAAVTLRRVGRIRTVVGR